MNEAELVECCKRKDMTAQNELYQRYAGEMFALCIRYSGNRDFAKDLLHDGFLKAFTSLDKFFYRLPVLHPNESVLPTVLQHHRALPHSFLIH